MQSLVQMGENAWEEIEKAGLRNFANLRKKCLAEISAYITRFNTIQGTHGYKVFECAIKYMSAISQNALSSIIVPPSGQNSQ